MGRRSRTRCVVAALALGAFSALCSVAHAEDVPDAMAPEPATAPEPPLRVAVAGSPPFVTVVDDQPQGLSVDVWRALVPALPKGAKANLKAYDTVQQALDAVASDEADLALGPISITAQRATQVSFSQPYYYSALSILAPARESFWLRLAPFATRAFGAGLLVLMLILGGVGAALWLCERRANPEQFPGRPIPGIGSGIWLALVTMTTVGYGDMAPRTRAGRVVAGVWMLIAMITASSLTASIATALTLSQLQTPGIAGASDLGDRPIAAIASSPAADFVRANGGRIHAVSSVSAGIAAVLDNKAHAAVWDRPVLAYYLQQHPDVPLTLSEARYDRRGYGIAARHGERELLRKLDVAVLRLQESGDLERLTGRWLDNP